MAVLILRACSPEFAEGKEVHKGLYGVMFHSTTDVVIWLWHRKFTGILEEKGAKMQHFLVAGGDFLHNNRVASKM